MSDWKTLERARVTKATPQIPEHYTSDSSYGFNGMFRLLIAGKFVRCIASDGMGWQHVSVTIEGESKPPAWDLMCKIKDLFWEPEDWVVQFHPSRSEYVNNHPGCLHLWRPTDATMPTPLAMMVGVKTK